MYHGPFPFAREAVPPAPSSRQSWKYFPTPVSVVNSQGPKGGGLPFPRESPGFYTRRPSPVPGVFPWASTGWGGYRGNEIFFMCEILCALGSPYNANESFFYVGVFRHFRCGKGPFPAGRVLSLPCGKRGLPWASTGLCARVCVRLSRMSRNTTSKAVSDRPAFFDGGSRYRPGKGKRLPTFFPKKSSPFCASQHPHSAAFLEEPAEGQHLFLYRN